ncbi:phosphotransferase family protein [Penicillium canescens]|nr:phosphotransferase family protein [Penicillium canescens]
MNMTKVLNMSDFRIEDRPHLDPNIDIDKLELLYGQMAVILLQLNELSLPRIGSLEQIDDFTFKVTHHPLSIHMNELVRVGALLRSKLQDSALESSSFSFDALADLHIDHLTHQRNDA